MPRHNPFDDLSDFAPETKPKPVAPAAIEQIARDNGFPSRQPSGIPTAPPRLTRRRYVTGRNQQLNIKATAETVGRFYRLADARHIPLGELLELALDALEREGGAASQTPSEGNDP